MKKILIALLLLPYFALGQLPTLDSLDAFISKQVADYKLPGLAVGIIKNNKVIFKKGYGVNSISENLPITAQTVFPISSCTKASQIAE